MSRYSVKPDSYRVRLEGCAGCSKGCRLHSKLDGQPGEDSKQRITLSPSLGIS